MKRSDDRSSEPEQKSDSDEGFLKKRNPVTFTSSESSGDNMSDFVVSDPEPTPKTRKKSRDDSTEDSSR